MHPLNFPRQGTGIWSKQKHLGGAASPGFSDSFNAWWQKWLPPAFLNGKGFLPVRYKFWICKWYRGQIGCTPHHSFHRYCHLFVLGEMLHQYIYYLCGEQCSQTLGFSCLLVEVMRKRVRPWGYITRAPFITAYYLLYQERYAIYWASVFCVVVNTFWLAFEYTSEDIGHFKSRPEYHINAGTCFYNLGDIFNTVIVVILSFASKDPCMSHVFWSIRMHLCNDNKYLGKIPISKGSTCIGSILNMTS